MISITLELPETAFSFLHKTPKEFAEEMKITAVIKWYEEGLLSQSKACEIAGISRIEFLNVLFTHNITPYQYTKKDLKDEFEG